MEDVKEVLQKEIDKDQDKVVSNHQFEPLTFEQVDLLSRMLNKDISNFLRVKNTNDYNFDLISTLLDKSAMLFMESGQKYINNGDVLHFLTFNENIFNVSQAFVDMDDDISSNSYNKYPFSLHVSSELRTKTLLKTETREDFSDLFVALKDSLKPYLSVDQINIINKAINKAKARIFKNQLKFINPIDGTEQGKEEQIKLEDYPKYDLDYLVDNEISDEDAEKIMSNEFKFDLRSDNFDIVALKELLLVLNKQEKFDYFSSAPGFFNKIMPELNELGVDAVIFRVQNNEITDIKLSSFVGRELSENNFMFSPLKATIALLSDVATEKEIKAFNMLDGTIKKQTKFLKFDETKLSNANYYITVSGAVASPSLENMELGYKKASFNTEIIEAGETFLFEQRDSKPMLTRMYFTPYSYDKIHIVHHHGSVIWGHNDQSFHSCSTAGEEFTGWEETAWFDLIKKTSLSLENSEIYSPAMISASHNLIKENKSKLFQFLSKKEYRDKRYLVTRSILETCNFTFQWEIAKMSFQSAAYNDASFKNYLMKISEGYAPLHKRFHLNTYLNENKLSFKQMPTLYNKVSLGKSKTEISDALDILSKDDSEDQDKDD